MKINPRSDCLKGHARPDEIEFQPAPLEGPTPNKKSRPEQSPLSPPQEIEKRKTRPTDEPSSPQTDQPTSQSVSQPIDQSTNRPTDRSTELSTALSAIRSPDRKLGRPAAFYITERQRDILDAVVAHFRTAHQVKTDRSALLGAVLGDPVVNFYDEDTHEEIIGRLIERLRGQLVGRRTDRQADRETGRQTGRQPEHHEERQSNHQR